MALTKIQPYNLNTNATFSFTDVAVTDVTANGNITGNYIIGNGSSLTQLTGANVTGAVAYATTANAVAGANVSGAVSYASTANAVAGANVSGTVANATYATTAGTADTVAGANVTGAVAYATTANSVAGANVTGTVANATYATSAGSATTAETVTTAAQPNITSVGTLTSLTVNGNISANNANITGNIVPTSNNTYSLGSASSYWKDAYIGPGSLYINGSKVLEESSNAIVISADLNQTVRVTAAGSGDVQLQTTGSGVIAVKGPLQIQVGNNITSSDGGPIGFTNPINVDTLSSLSANTNLTITANGSGTVQINDDVTITGNLSINGGGGNLSVTSLSVEDNIIDISAETTGTPVNNAGIRVIRGDDPAVQNRWNETTETWQITNDGSTYLNVVGANTTSGNVSVGNIAASLGNFTTVTGTLTTAAQPNITSTGTLSSLSVTGDVTGGNLITSGTSNVGTLVVGSGGANINGYTKITGNIDVTGNFNVSGNLNYQNVTDLVVGDPLIYLAANNVGDTDDIGIVGNYNDGTYAHTGVARDHTDGTWKFFTDVHNEPTTTIDWANAQYPSVKTGNLFSANITGTGWANITGNLLAGNANLGNAATANYFIGSGANLTNITGANVTGAVAYATTANSVAGGNVSGQVSYAATANSVAGANVSGEVSFAAAANSVAGANVTGAVAYATTANSVAGANVSGAVNLADYATTANAVALANVSGAGSIASINIDGNSSNILYGSGVFASAPVTYGNSNVATFLGSYGSNTITTTGNVSVGNIIGNGQALTGLAGANVIGAVSLATYATTANSVAGANVSGQVSYAATANSVAGANVSGAVSYATTANSVAGGNVSGAVAYATTANSVAGANVSGAVGLATYATTANSVAGANVSGQVSYAGTANSVSGANVSGAVTYASTANSVAGANVSGAVSSATTAGTVTTAAQGNITSVGTLSSLSVSGVATTPKVLINRSSTASTGISWYSSSYSAWTDYMSPAGATGCGPFGNITAPAGNIVTNWGLRSFIEDATGYGWTWESGSSGQTTPAVKAEIRSSDGSFRNTGNIYCVGDVYSAYSDINLKDVVGPIENAIDTICSIETFYYRPNELAKSMGIPDELKVGVNAQSVKAKAPEVTGPSPLDPNFLTVQYERLVPYLIECIKHQQKQIDELNKKLGP